MSTPAETDRLSIIVRRVTLPRYEVEYREARLALEHAEQIKSASMVSVGHEFAEPVGQEVVLDLGIHDEALKTTLLFRIVQRYAGQTVLEWWARRKTDPDMLDLWIDGLGQLTSSGTTAEMAVPPAEMQALYEFCRRALSQNPFVALGVHWTAAGEQVEAAARESIERVARYRALPKLSPRVRALLDKDETGIAETRKMLGSLEQRRVMRGKYVPAHQIEQARELATSKLEIARLRQDRAEFTRAQTELRELGGPVS